MTTRPWRALLGSALAALLLTVAACAVGGDGGSEKEDDMTPDEALAGLRKAAAGLLGTAAPGNELVEADPRTNIPCGGLGGNEHNKVKHAYEAGAGLVDDAEAALDAAESQLDTLGLEKEGREVTTLGPTLTFAGDGFRGDLVVLDSGAIQVQAQTACLDNPDR